MTKEERAAFAREAERRVRGCVLSRRGQALPSAREIQRETGIASLSTVHRYLHRLAEAGEIALPEESYPSASRRGGQLGIRHKLIRVYTPRHNGKVERRHRKDNEYFYASHKFYSFEDFRKQLAVWQYKYNGFPMRPLNWRSPKQVLSAFPDV